MREAAGVFGFFIVVVCRVLSRIPAPLLFNTEVMRVPVSLLSQTPATGGLLCCESAYISSTAFPRPQRVEE